MIQFNNDSLNPTKAHGVDNISICMIQLSGDSIKIPLFPGQGIFSDTWKIANINPVHEKESKSLVKNYRAISLLPIFDKIFERLLFTFLFFHFNSNNPFNKC